jgi:hypothetical protein
VFFHPGSNLDIFDPMITVHPGWNTINSRSIKKEQQNSATTVVVTGP